MMEDGARSSPNLSKLTTMSSAPTANGGKHTCQLCGYQTLKKTHLKLHAWKVHNEKPFHCPECDYQATKKCNVVIH